MWQAMCLRVGAAALALFVLVRVNATIAAILAPFLPLWMMFEYLRLGARAFDYRVIYFGANAFWLLSWVSSSLVYQYLEQPLRVFHSYGDYAVTVVFCSLAGLLLPTIHIPRKILANANATRKPAVLLFLFFSALSVALFLAHVTSDYMITLLMGPEMALATIIFLLTPADRRRRRLALAAIFFIAMADGVTINVSRTAILLPIWCTGMAFAMRNYYFERVLSYRVILYALPLLVFLAIFADGLKAAATLGVFEGGGLAIFGILSHVKFSNLVQAGLTAHNYLQTKSAAASYYFLGLDNMQHFQGKYFGILLYQLFTVFIPRQFFPGKPPSDIVRLMYQRNEIELPSQYDPFYEKMGDAWIAGGVFYSILPMLMYAVLAKTALSSRYPAIRLCGIATYILNMVAIFITVRGPYIAIIWVAVPSLLLAALMIIVHFRQKRNALAS